MVGSQGSSLLSSQTELERFWCHTAAKICLKPERSRRACITHRVTHGCPWMNSQSWEYRWSASCKLCTSSDSHTTISNSKMYATIKIRAHTPWLISDRYPVCTRKMGSWSIKFAKVTSEGMCSLPQRAGFVGTIRVGRMTWRVCCTCCASSILAGYRFPISYIKIYRHCRWLTAKARWSISESITSWTTSRKYATCFQVRCRRHFATSSILAGTSDQTTR